MIDILAQIDLSKHLSQGNMKFYRVGGGVEVTKITMFKNNIFRRA